MLLTRREVVAAAGLCVAAMEGMGAMAADGKSFADSVAASLPGQIALPEEIRAALDWCESAGAVHTYRNSGRPYAFVYPGEWAGLEGRSLVTFQTRDADYVLHWTYGHVDAAERLAPIVRTGGDGSYAALWRDDDGSLKVVHMGSGSGSTMLGVLCDGPVDLLRLMAIGYEELCWQESYGQTPQEAFVSSSMFERPGGTVPPVEFRYFVESTFGVVVPGRATEIVKHRVAEMGDEPITDPFARWLASLEPRHAKDR